MSGKDADTKEREEHCESFQSSSHLTQSLACKQNHGKSQYNLAKKCVLNALDQEGSKPNSLYI